MNNYLKVTIAVKDAETSERLVAMLAAMGYEGFEEGELELKAFIPEKDFSDPELKGIITPLGISYAVETIEPQNWNAEWERSFEPVSVGDFAAVRASFHQPDPSVQYDIVITPKMSFGTGHHATTWMMIDHMRQLDVAGKTVLDFGTGTGVLAILAEKMGASAVLGIDNDEWSIQNALENLEGNHCSKTSIQMADFIPAGRKWDIILANINLNVITANLAGLVQACKAGTRVIFSGFLRGDAAQMEENLARSGFGKLIFQHRGDWLSISSEYITSFAQ